MTTDQIFRGLLNVTVNVEEQSQVRDAQNQIVTSWAVKIADMPCRIHKMSTKDVFSSVGKGGQASDGLGEFAKNLYRISAEIINDIVSDNRVNANGRIYEIITASIDSSNHHWMLECKLLDL